MTMKLVAEILTGGLFYVEVEEESTVGDLKKKIGNQENLPSDRLILMLDSDQRDLMTEDDVSLKEYGVQDGSHVYLFFESVGDGLPESPSTPQESVLINESCSTFFSVSNEPDSPEEPDPSEEPANELDDPVTRFFMENPLARFIAESPPDIDFLDTPSPSTVLDTPSPSTSDPSDQKDQKDE